MKKQFIFAGVGLFVVALSIGGISIYNSTHEGSLSQEEFNFQTQSLSTSSGISNFCSKKQKLVHPEICDKIVGYYIKIHNNDTSQIRGFCQHISSIIPIGTCSELLKVYTSSNNGTSAFSRLPSRTQGSNGNFSSNGLLNGGTNSNGNFSSNGLLNGGTNSNGNGGTNGLLNGGTNSNGNGGTNGGTNSNGNGGTNGGINSNGNGGTNGLPAGNNTFSCDQAVDVTTEECEALVSLYNSTDGDNRTNNEGRLEDVNIDNWYGVDVNVSGIRRIHLSNNGLKGSLPIELGNLDLSVGYFNGTNLLCITASEAQSLKTQLGIITNTDLDYSPDGNDNNPAVCGNELINGVCGSLFNCLSGYPANGHDTECGTDDTWQCVGANGGVTADCSKGEACPIDGECGTWYDCTAGWAQNAHDTECGTDDTWSCAGLNGGETTYCSKVDPCPVINGACSDVLGECSAGTLKPNSLYQAECGMNQDSTWICEGSNGGSDANCSNFYC